MTIVWYTLVENYLYVPKSKHKVVVTRCLKNYNSHELNEDLKYNFENFVFDTSDPNEMWESWKIKIFPTKYGFLYHT